jgi:FecR protein
MLTSALRAVFSAALLAMLFVAGPVAAQEIASIDPNADVTTTLGWRVSGLTGEASARLGSAPYEALAIGDIVPVGSEIQTERGSVVFLSRRGDRVIIQPASHLRIAEPKAGGLLTQFIQSFGNVFYDVEPRSSRSFGVQGPYMAAVVKGTRFLVTANRKANSVRVDEGRVLVAAVDGTSSAMVGPGNVATVERGGNGGVQVWSSNITIPIAVVPVFAQPTMAPEQGAPGADAAADTATETTGTSGGVVGSVGKAAGGLVGGVAGAVGGVAGAAGGLVGGVAEAAGGVVGDVADAAGGVVGGARKAVDGVVGGAGKAVGGLLGRR